MTAIFKFGEQELMFVGTWDNPEFRAKDVIDILYPESDPRNRGNYLDKVPPKWKGHKKYPTPGGEQECLTLLEPGLYYLVARSNSPLAIPFQEWLFEEVLPTIRRTGGYQFNSRLAAENAELKQNWKRLHGPMPNGSLTLGTVARMHGLHVEGLLTILAEYGETDIIKTFCKVSKYQRVVKDHLTKIEALVDRHRRLHAETEQLDLLNDLLTDSDL